MIQKNVLVVDDDRALLEIVKTKLNEGHENVFSVLTAADGLDAIGVLKKHSISLVVTDLQMPRMDGFGLLAHMSKNYPDISVIIMTAYEKAKTRKIVKTLGAAGYIKKPFKVSELTQRILKIFHRESEGGNLFKVSLEMYIQMIEMEQKTCTLRIVEQNSGRHGTIFFKEGALFNARIKTQRGIDAAYEILSWGQVSLSIEESCSITKKAIDEDIQAILLEAMRLKDERESEFNAEESKIDDDEPIVDLNHSLDDDGLDGDEPFELKTEVRVEEEHSDGNITNEEIVRHRIEKAIGTKNGLGDVYPDNSWNEFIAVLAALGESLQAGSLKACYILKSNADNLILVPGEEDTTVISLQSHRERDKILEILSE